ncbi:MAG: pyrroline-5-carboxylate reductase [Lentisphaeria bacterium]
MKIGFLGTGKMATAIARGMLTKGIVSKTDIFGVDISEKAREEFAKNTGAQPKALPDKMVDDADILVIAVKPQVAEDAVKSIADQGSGKLLISIAAGLPLSKLCAWFNSQRVVRVMPNTPAMIGRGASAFCCAAEVTRKDINDVRNILTAIGTVNKVKEELMDAVTALSGSGPAYVFEMVQALTEAGTACDLPPDIAGQLAIQTVSGSAEMLSKGLGTPEDLRDAVTTPGGTTAAGLAVMEDNGFRKMIEKTVRAARDRSMELGGGKG